MYSKLYPKVNVETDAEMKVLRKQSVKCNSYTPALTL